MLQVKESAQRPLQANKGYKFGAKAATPAQIDAAAREFESQFVSQMLGTMMNTVDPEESLGGSDSEDVYNSMLVNEYGKIIARTGGIGVADQVKQMMISQQEVTPKGEE